MNESDHSGIRLETNSKRNHREYIKTNIEANKNENTTYYKQWDSMKMVLIEDFIAINDYRNLK
jgi:hypothetical protein